MQVQGNYRAREAAQYLGIGVSTLWAFTKAGKIRSIKLSPRVTLWSKSELEAFVTQQSEAQNEH